MGEILPIENRIFTFRNQQVMVDRDLAEMYQVDVKRLNEQIKRNSSRFPRSFRLQLSVEEKNELVANCDRFQQGIFFDGQMFDAYVFIADLIKTAQTEIILIDNYIDESVLLMLQKRNTNCSCTIYTQNPSKTLLLDLKKHNSQYPKIDLKTFANAHDRFLILDQTTVYHIGASLKDLGKKWFAFSKLEMQATTILNALNKANL